MPAIISIVDVAKTYATGFQALKQVNLHIRRGEIFALLGPNGAGKTTLINVVCGIVKPSARQSARSTAMTSSRDYRAARAMIGLVPQELTTDAFETVWATVIVQPRAVRQAAEPGADREGAEGPVAVGQDATTRS